MASRLNNPVQMAVIGAPHGVRGELRVKSFTGDPLALGDYGPLSSQDGRSFDVAAIRPAKEVVVVRFKGVDSREAAEKLTGTALFVERDRLPPEDDDEFYHADLVGLAVRDETGKPLGRVTSVQNFGGGDILELTLGGRSLLIPFTSAAVPAIDIQAGFVTVDRQAAGLVDNDNDGDGGDGEPGGGR